MNPYLNVLMSVIILYFASLLYNQYKLHEKWNDDVEHYNIVKQFLIEDNTNAIQNYYKVTQEIYKQIIFKDALQPYLETIKPHYHKSKQNYVTRKMNYSRFITVIRHLCKLLDITYTSTMKYSNSTYRIDYLIYLNDYE